jgi:acetyl esterase/lipase
MKNTLGASFAVFLALILHACSPEEASMPNSPLEAETRTAVSYGSHVNQTYDIYLPEKRNRNTPVIILIHGGGWTSGDKADMEELKNFLQDQLPHLATVNMNYRLADEANPPYPMQIDDISAVVNDLKVSQNTYQIGGELGLIGVSAGGHLSLLWSYRADLENQVKMVCSIVGPTNLADEAYLNSGNPLLEDLISQFGEDLSFLKAVSPLHQADATAPPTILFYGGQDPFIPNSQGMDLNDKLNTLNVTHEFIFYPGEGHGWMGSNLLDTSIKLKSFIENHLN